MPQLLEGQFAVTKDTEEVFAGIAGKNVRVLDEKDRTELEEAIANVEVDIDTSGLATKTELQEAIENVEVDTTNLATKPELDDLAVQLTGTDTRIDNIIATAGDGTVPTELVDLRVNSEGVRYTTAGSRIKNIENSVFDTRSILGIGRREQTEQGDILSVSAGNNEVSVAGTGTTSLYVTKKNQFTTDYVATNAVLRSKGEGRINLFATSGSTFKLVTASDFFLPKGKYILKGDVVTISGSPNSSHAGMVYVYKRGADGTYPTTTLRTELISKGVKFELTEPSFIRFTFYLVIGAALTADTEISIQNIMLSFGETALPYEAYAGTKQTVSTGQYTTISTNGDSYLYAENGGLITRRYYEGTDTNKIQMLETEIEKIKNEVEKPADTVVCVGDSLTSGTGATTGKPASDTNSDVSYPAVLSRRLGGDINVVNAGVGGETSWMVAARQGGMPLKIAPTTIPANTSQVRVHLEGMEKDAFYDGGKWTFNKDNLSYNIGVEEKARINPCTINGIEGTLSRTLVSSGQPDPTTGETVQTNTYAYYFSRSEPGTVSRFITPVDLITYAAKEYQDAIQIFWVGQNDAPSRNGAYIMQAGVENRVQNMADHLNHKKYIVVKYPSGTDTSETGSDQNFTQKFGKHFINIRKYLVRYGVPIANELGANITISPADQALIEAGQVPSCLRIDGIHLNYWGYQGVARAVHEKGKDLGYW